MKKVTVILILIMAILSIIFVSCNGDRVNTDESSDSTFDSSNDTSIDTDNSQDIDYDAQFEELSKDLDTVKSKLENESSDSFLNTILDELNDISAECIFNDEATKKSLILKNGIIAMLDEEAQLLMKVCGNSLIMLSTVNNKTTCATIDIPQDETVNEGDFILTKEHIVPTNNPNEYMLSKQCLRELSKYLIFLTEKDELEEIKNAAAFVDFGNYINSKEVNFNISYGGKQYTSTLGLSGLIDGNSYASFVLKEGENALIDFSALYENNEAVSINLSTVFENEETKITYNSSQIKLFIKENDKTIIDLSIDITESEIKELPNYDLKLKCEIDDIENGQIDIKALFTGKSYKNGVKEYLLQLTTLENGEEKTSGCTFITPTDKEITLSEYESKLISRVEAYQKDKELIDTKASYFAKDGAEFFKNYYYDIRANKIPTVYYKYDDVNDIIYLVQYQATNIFGEIQYTSQVIIDYENYIYYYNEVIDSFESCKPSQQQIDIALLMNGLNKFNEKYEAIIEENMSNPYVYSYIEAENKYLCVSYNKNDYVAYMLTPSDFYEFSLVNYCCPIYYVGNEPSIHIPISSTYDEKCKEIFLCGECGCSFKSKASVHETVNEIVQEQGENTPIVTVDKCVRCDYRSMNIGDEFFINLEYSEYYEGYKIVGIDIPNPYDNMVLEIPSMNDSSIISIKSFGYDSDKHSFKKISFPNEMKYIEDGSIRGIKIEELILPNSLYKIESNGIESCSIRELIIPEKTSYLEDYFIHYCSGLKKVTINSKSLVKFGRLEQSFDELIFNGSCNNFKCPKGIKALTLPIGTLTIDGIEYARNLSKITIPEGTKQIKEGMFKDCEGLTELIIPSTVTFIGNYAFEGCINFTSIVIPSTVKKISEHAFVLSSISVINYDGTSTQWSAYLPITLTNINVRYLKKEEQA
ncbi:MAG: leucine-rich repeat protein [Clostridia bacterium]|nr:leucine-rich repeat protein [Clostridia bacterium]